METLLEIRDLSVTFQDVEGTRAARHVNLQLKKGELAALVGESGSGKTVLCKTILQLLGKKTRVESGQILYRDSNILEYTEKQMQKFRGKEISMVFQDPYLESNDLYRKADHGNDPSSRKDFKKRGKSQNSGAFGTHRI